MRYAIFGDMHSNLEAYEAFVADAKNESIDQYLCVGDVVGYGADPDRCIEITKNLQCPTVAGNNDMAVINKLPLDNFNIFAREAIEWTKEHISDEGIRFLSNLDYVHEEEEIVLTHGSLRDPSDFNYVTDRKSAHVAMALQQRRFCFVGHTHIPCLFYYESSGDLDFKYAPRIKLQENTEYLVNVGSIGQPRDGDWHACYCIYDSREEIIRFKRIEYDVKKASEKILKAGLPGRLSERILSGR